jgi:hypothetical protein
VTDTAISPGQTYRSADPRDAADPTRFRVDRTDEQYAYGTHLHTARASRILLAALHVDPTTRQGRLWRTGYVLVRDAEEPQS